MCNCTYLRVDVFGGLTRDLKVMRLEPLLCICINFGLVITELAIHTMETHWPLFKESPTYTILLFLRLSSNFVPLNLFTYIKTSVFLSNVHERLNDDNNGINLVTILNYLSL